jgi:hypothetical protein
MVKGNHAQPPIVNIERFGNVLGVTPDMFKILGPELTFTRKEMDNDWVAGGGLTMQFVKEGLYRVESGTLYTLQGALTRIQNKLKKCKIPFTFTDKRKVTHIEPDFDHLHLCMPKLQFRLKQDEALAHLIAHNSGQIEAPTGYGKTFLMLALMALYPKSNIIIASPTTALLKGTYRRALDITGDVGIVGDGRRDPRRVTLSTYNSIMRCRVEECDILMLDEAHRAAGPDISANVARMRNLVKIFGLSASPDGRSDGAELRTEVLIGPHIYTVDYKEAAAAGIVSKIKVVMVPMMDHQVNTIPCSDSTTRKRWYYWKNLDRNERLVRALKHYPDALTNTSKFTKSTPIPHVPVAMTRLSVPSSNSRCMLSRTLAVSFL